MADLSGMGIDPEVKEVTPFNLIPEGKYLAVIIKDELTNNKANTGKLFNFELQIQQGPYKGSCITARLNLTNPSAKAQAIGQGQLKKVCSITMVQFPPADTRKMWGIPFVIDVAVETFTSNTSQKELKSNYVKAFYSVTEMPKEVVSQQAQMPPAVPPPAVGASAANQVETGGW